jgi:hypothetical protein
LEAESSIGNKPLARANTNKIGNKRAIMLLFQWQLLSFLSLDVLELKLLDLVPWKKVKVS